MSLGTVFTLSHTVNSRVGKGHRDILQRATCNFFFQTGFVVAEGGFLSYWNYQLIKFEEENRFGL